MSGVSVSYLVDNPGVVNAISGFDFSRKPIAIKDLLGEFMFIYFGDESDGDPHERFASYTMLSRDDAKMLACQLIYTIKLKIDPMFDE